MTPTSPPVAAWELGMRLREFREQRDLQRIEVANAVGITQNYLSNIEHGRRTVAEDKLSALIDLYDIADHHDELFGLRRASNRRGWWSRYNTKLPAELTKLFSYMHGASAFRSYEPGVISGLLQTTEYARAIHQSDQANVRLSDVDARIAARLRNQERLSKPEPLPATIVMTEAALRQQVGGTAVLAGQLEHLLTLLDWHADTLDVRIIPFDAGSYGALGSSTFHLLEFAGHKVRRLAWHETVTTLQLLDDEDLVHSYDICFANALDRAADQETSKKLITEALEDIT